MYVWRSEGNFVESSGFQEFRQVPLPLNHLSKRELRLSANYRFYLSCRLWGPLTGPLEIDDSENKAGQGLWNLLCGIKCVMARQEALEHF